MKSRKYIIAAVGVKPLIMQSAEKAPLKLPLVPTICPKANLGERKRGLVVGVTLASDNAAINLFYYWLLGDGSSLSWTEYSTAWCFFFL